MIGGIAWAAALALALAGASEQWVVQQQRVPFGLAFKTAVVVHNGTGGDVSAVVEVVGRAVEFDGRARAGTWRSKRLTFAHGVKVQLLPEQLADEKGAAPTHSLVVERVRVIDADGAVAVDVRPEPVDERGGSGGGASASEAAADAARAALAALKAEQRRAIEAAPWVPSPDAKVRLRVCSLPTAHMTVVEVDDGAQPRVEPHAIRADAGGPGFHGPFRVWSKDGQYALVAGPAPERGGLLANGDAVPVVYDRAGRKFVSRGVRELLAGLAFDPALALSPVEPLRIVGDAIEAMRDARERFDLAAAIDAGADAEAELRARLATRPTPRAQELQRALERLARYQRAAEALQSAWAKADAEQDAGALAKLVYDSILGMPGIEERERLLPRVMKLPSIVARARRRFPMRLVPHDKPAADQIVRRAAALGIPIVVDGELGAPYTLHVATGDAVASIRLESTLNGLPVLRGRVGYELARRSFPGRPPDAPTAIADRALALVIDDLVRGGRAGERRPVVCAVAADCPE